MESGAIWKAVMSSSGSPISQLSLRLDVALLLLRIACAAAFLYQWERDTVRRFWWAWSPELLYFSPLSGDHWLSGGSRTGCGLAILTGVFLRIGAACIMVVDRRDSPRSYCPRMRRGQGRLRVRVRSTCDCFFALSDWPWRLFASRYSATAAAQALVLALPLL